MQQSQAPVWTELWPHGVFYAYPTYDEALSCSDVGFLPFSFASEGNKFDPNGALVLMSVA